MKTAIVTGANGFVGKAVCRVLMEQGITVYAVVRSGAQHLDGLEGAVLTECDMDSYSALAEKLTGVEEAVFYHFAWQGSAGPMRGDDRVQLANISHTCDAVRAAAQLGCRYFVMAGSIMEYEVEAAMRTTQTPAVSTLYCTAKKAANYMARALAASLGINYMCGLISNIYGPGEFSPRLINSSIRKLLKGEHASFSPGEQLYDFIYVEDAARMFYFIGEQGRPGMIYYIGNKEQRPLKEFLLEMRDVVAPGTPLGLGDFPFNGVSLTYREFDTEALFRDTDFQISVSFAEGIENTIKWIQQQDKEA